MQQRMTQSQMYYSAQQREALINKTFLDMVTGGLTRAQLEQHIANRPELWGRFTHWLPKLP